MRWKSTETPTFAGSAGSNRAPAVAETMELLDRDGAVVATYTKAVDGTLSTVTNGVKRYVALLTQTSTDAPVATVLENTLGGTVVWTRTGVGQYIATLAGVFAANKTTPVNAIASGDPDSATKKYMKGQRATDNTFELFTGDPDNASTDDCLVNTLVEIRVYP